LSDDRSVSAELYERALGSLPGGVSRNTVLRRPHPFYADRAVGCRVVDVDGVERIDFANNMASLIHGHAHPEIIRAVTEQLPKGTAFTLATEVEIRFAEHLRSRNIGFERLRFVNSGTEAVMAALKTARAFTGRTMIAKVEGAYHGAYDFAEVSQTSNPSNWGGIDRPHKVPTAFGTPQSVLDDVVVLPFNDTDRALSLLDEHRGELACVLLDPMPHRVGLVPANKEFVSALHDWTISNDSLFVMDEVITFRSEYGGAQTWYDVQPDLTALGKIIGGGFPVGALAGRAEIMNVMNPFADSFVYPQSGTFSANPITMTAGLVAMEMYDEAAVAEVNRLAKLARTGIEEVIRSIGARACVSGGGSILRVHLKEAPPQGYREAFPRPEESSRLALLFDHLFEAGVMMINTCSATISTPMTEAEIGFLVAALESGLPMVAD